MRLETLYYQRVFLQKLFARENLPLEQLRWRMENVLLKKFSHTAGKEELKNALLSGGSLAYNHLAGVLGIESRSQDESFPELSDLLNSHGVKELYRYVWIWSEDGHIMKRGDSWFTSKDKCLADGRLHQPNYYTYDGPGAPIATLCVESICPCNIHLISGFYAKVMITTPCHCFNSPNTRNDTLKPPGSFVLVQPATLKIPIHTGAVEMMDTT